jgi:K+-sensing histidine kinase KdpD
MHAQRMEAVGRLTGGVAHDFNNLLSAIIGSLDLAERRGAAGADTSKFLRNARLAAERGATLTQRMLSFARKQELTLESVDLATSVGNMADLMVRTLGNETTVETCFENALPPAEADAAQLELALLNLVVNARDAMPAGGRVSITARQAQGEDGAYVVLAVTDEGEGMDADTLRRATEPFFTTKGIGRGTGLGLPMVLGMAEQCGGRLDIQSTPGKGTTAELWLKAATDVATLAPPTIVAPEQTGPLEILLVDDDLIVLMNAVAMLEDMGHRVREASSAAAALDLLARHPVDLLISDFAMPGMNGAEQDKYPPGDLESLSDDNYRINNAVDGI